jgi:hypothetical protein
MNLENQTFYNLEQRERVVYITSEVIIVLESLDPLLLLVVEPRGLVATLFVLLWPPLYRCRSWLHSWLYIGNLSRIFVGCTFSCAYFFFLSQCFILANVALMGLFSFHCSLHYTLHVEERLFRNFDCTLRFPMHFLKSSFEKVDLRNVLYMFNSVYRPNTVEPT